MVKLINPAGLLQEHEQEVQRVTLTDEVGSDLATTIIQGLDLLYKALDCILDDSYFIDGVGTDKDSTARLLVIRYTIGAWRSARWCLDMLLSGYYGSAMSLLRKNYEEVVRAAYYSEYPRQAISDWKSFSKGQMDVKKMADALDLAVFREEYKAMHKIAHATTDGALGILIEANEPDNPGTISAAPQHDSRAFARIGLRLLSDLGIAVVALDQAFEKEVRQCGSEAGDWDTNFVVLIATIQEQFSTVLKAFPE